MLLLATISQYLFVPMTDARVNYDEPHTLFKKLTTLPRIRFHCRLYGALGFCVLDF